MNTISILAVLSFYSYDTKGLKINRIYNTNMITDFSIRKDMFNSGKIFFLNKQYVYAGENNIESQVLFAYKDLVSPFLTTGKHFIFGEIAYPYGEGVVIKII